MEQNRTMVDEGITSQMEGTGRTPPSLISTSFANNPTENWQRKGFTLPLCHQGLGTPSFTPQLYILLSHHLYQAVFKKERWQIGLENGKKGEVEDVQSVCERECAKFSAHIGVEPRCFAKDGAEVDCLSCWVRPISSKVDGVCLGKWARVGRSPLLPHPFPPPRNYSSWRQ